MDLRDELGPEGGMNRPVPRDPAHPGEDRRPQDDAEMALSAVAVAGMAAMRLAFVHNLEPVRRERGRQPCLYFRSYRHFFTRAPSKRLKIP